jgi:hypothetical protein
MKLILYKWIFSPSLTKKIYKCHFKKKAGGNQTWWCTSIIPALGRQKIANLRPA